MVTRDKSLLALCMLGLILVLPLTSLASAMEIRDGRDAPTEGKASLEEIPGSPADDSGVRSRGGGALGEMKQLRPFPIPPGVIASLPGPAPTNVTLTPVTPTNIMIQWSPSAGAVRYLISRNGAPDIRIEANAGFLQGNRFGYTDVGRRPATLHTYSVTAQFPAPTLPGRSSAAQVLTPPASAPQNFKASISAPNAVTLNWTARPEATSYRLIRNGGNLPATVLNPNSSGGASHVDQNLPPGEYSYIVYSVVRLASGEELLGEFSNPLIIKTRPFNIVALGDSIMWGQGLLHPHKFVTKFQSWIGDQLKKPAILNFQAHSGAITYPAPDTPVYENRSYDGEVPADWPTISHQIGLASSSQTPTTNVDIILIDGCANNVGIITVLNPFLNDDALRTETRGNCGAGMTNILSEVVQKFPNAKVIVTGLFPYVSTMSATDKLLPVFGIVGAFIPPDPIVGGIVVTEAYKARAGARSDLFFQESNSSLQAAVDTVNGMMFEGRTKFNQIAFARLNAGPDNAYAAPNTWQWLIPAPPFAQDEVYEHRRSECAKLAQDPQHLPGASLLCLQASMGHPNVAGAQAYTDAIVSAAGPFLPEWRTAHLGPATAAEDSLAIKVQPISSEPSGGTMVVTATDGASGPALLGAVQLNGIPNGALGAQIRYAYQQNNPTDILVRVDVAGRRPRSFTIPLRTQAIAVNVTNGGDPRSAIVVATDSATGQVLSGTVTINARPNQVKGATGQPLNYPSCGQINQPQRFTKVAITPGPIPCTGTVHVPYYPDASYQDLPGTITLAIQEPVNLLPKAGPP